MGKRKHNRKPLQIQGDPQVKPENSKLRPNDIIAICIGTAVTIVLFLEPKKSPAIAIICLAALAVCLLFLVFNWSSRWPWIREAPPATRMWNLSFLSLLTLVGVILYGVHSWPSESTEAKILRIIQDENEQQKLLKLYPLGYTIFEVDAVTQSVEPRQTHQGERAYGFNYSKVRILENTPTRISLQLPDLLENGKLVLADARIGGDKTTMQQYGAGYVFTDENESILGTGQILEYSGNRFTWIFGLRSFPKT